MADDDLRYDLMVESALRGVVRQAVSLAAERGLPGDHHFYISFRTRAPGVTIAKRLGQLHPDEMTIVLQHQYWDLAVHDDAFSISLSFGGKRERLVIPFTAITAFVDPSVNFGLPFKPADTQGDVAPDHSEAPEKPSGEVVRLDKFRSN